MAACGALLDLLLGTGLGGCVRHRLSCTLASHIAGDHGWATLNCLQALNRVVSALVKPALASLFMSYKVIVEPVTAAVRTIYTENILKKVHHNAIRLLHLYFIVALRAG